MIDENIAQMFGGDKCLIRPVALQHPLHHVHRANEIGHKARIGKFIQIRRRGKLHQPPPLHHGAAGRHCKRFILVMRHHHEGDANLVLQRCQLKAHRLAQLGVECRQGLIQQQHARPLGERPRKRHPLPLAAGKLVRLAIAQPVQLHECQHFLHPAGAFRAAHAVQLQAIADIVGHAHVREHRIALKNRVHRPAVWRNSGHVHAIDGDAAFARRFESGQHAQQCRLARA